MATIVIKKEELTTLQNLSGTEGTGLQMKDFLTLSVASFGQETGCLLCD